MRQFAQQAVGRIDLLDGVACSCTAMASDRISKRSSHHPRLPQDHAN
ncbi:hypothetical protein ACWD3Z_27985 [Streptomyces sp. NPDC002740]